MRKETMTPRERWLAVLTRKKPDRVPMDFWGTTEAREKLCKHLGCDFETALQRLHVDVPFNVGPKYIGPSPMGGEDMWGFRYKEIQHEGGIYREVANHPLAAFESAAEIEANYRWPSADWWDYSEIPSQIKGHEHEPIRGGGSEPFLVYKNLRGDEQAFIDLVENPEIIEYCMGKMFELAYQNTLRIFESIPGKVMITYVAEDLGGQDALLYSPSHIRRFLLPHMKRMMDLTRQHGSFVFFHSDGAIRDIIPDMIAAGIHVMNPIQWGLPGMDREGLKRDFGSKVIFHGAVDNQYTLPFGTVAEVKKEVADNLRILGAGGGYILAPCHNIQVVSPPENIIAMYETGYELGWR